MTPNERDMEREVNRREALEYHRANPLDVTSFATSRIGLGMPRLFRRQASFLEALFPTPSDMDDPITNPSLDEGVALWGKGSGKDTVAVLGQAYGVYRLLLHDDPRAWLRTPIGDTVDLVNVAYNADQAKDVFFERARSRYLRSPFFRLIPEFHPERDVSSDFIRFPFQVHAHSLHAQSDAAEGLNTFIGVMDEADAFLDKSKRANADAMLKTISSSIDSRYKHTRVGKQGLAIILSWPRHAESFTIKEYTRSVPIPTGTTRPIPYSARVHGSRGATWEIRGDEGHPARLTRDDFVEAYAKDPEDARAKFETLPPASEDAFFTLPDKLDACFRGRNIVQWSSTIQERVIKGDTKRFAAIELHDVTPAPGFAYWIHCDAGLRRDSYALAMTRADGDRRIVEALIEWEPRDGVPVDFLNVRRTILDLAANFTIVGVSFDQWNSAEGIQEMQAHGLNAEEHTYTQPYTLRIYQNLKTLAYGDRLIFPASGPSVEKLRRELRRLQLLRGAKVDHPPGESKDLADAVADSCFMAREDAHGAIVEQAPTLQPELLRDASFNETLLRPGW